MKLDKYSRPIFSDSEIFNLLYEGKIDSLAQIISEKSEEIDKFNQFSEFQISTVDKDIYDMDIVDFDLNNQEKWFMPDEYKNMDIEGFLVHVCPKQNYQRLIDELQEYRNRNLLDLLKWLKYFVDTMRSNNIIWGIGRGSSVASYVLFLIGVHKIDSIQYKLDWREFLR